VVDLDAARVTATIEVGTDPQQIALAPSWAWRSSQLD
jgi:hypothetical protein